MNCISRLHFRILLLCLASCAACGAKVSGSLVPADPLTYRIEYVATPDPANGTVDVVLTLTQGSALLRSMTMQKDARISGLDGDGELLGAGSEVRWVPPASGGTLRWSVAVSHRRNGDGYDALLGTDWGLFRAEDIIPRATTRTLKGSVSETWLTLKLPVRWSAVTQYFSTGTKTRIDNPERRFDQPSGWIVIGDLGVRREIIAGVRVAVAGPVDNGVRRLDTLALLNWTLPELARILPDLPPRLTIVSAGDPMWRGGLSAPESLFLHAARPLISENATSTLLHEVMHLSLGLDSREGFDWIVEGLAEYYSLQLLFRSGTITNSRYRQAKTELADWATSASSLCRRASTGATTALAVGVFAALNDEVIAATKGASDLDDVVRSLRLLDRELDLDALVKVFEDISGSKSDTLHIDKLPGCRSIGAIPEQT
jgi:hypothetical protein